MDEMVRLPGMADFTRNQMEEIQEGVEKGLDVSVYAKKDFLAIQMRQIRLGLMEGLRVEEYAKAEYDWFQMEEIRKGLEDGIDISVFASPDISYDRMQQIRMGLKEGVDLSAYKRLDAGTLKQMRLATKNHVNIVPYIIAGYDAEQLEAIREALEKGLDITPWVQKEYRGIALQEIFLGLENGLDVSAYATTDYNWQQMREIRLGIEHMLDIEQYKSASYSYRQMKEIRLGLEAGYDVSYYRSPMYTALEMHKRRIYMEENPSVAFESMAHQEENGKGRNDDSAAEFYTITVSPDEMEAYIEVHGFSARFDKIDIVKALREKGVCYGVKYDAIDNVVSGNSPRKPILIACGKQLVDGKDGWYEFFFRTEVMHTPKQLEDGTVDYRDVDWFETVEKDQKLAVYHRAEPGENGITVTGRMVPARNGREKSILTGKGFHRLPDAKTYISDMQGIVTLQDCRMNVSELLILKEVNMATGDVEYAGNVLIEGNVSSGSRITAAKDVIVKGFVEAAQIVCGGNVFLQKGMNGSGNGLIRAIKDVIGYFFEGVEVYAGGNIQGDYFFKSALHAQGEVKAVGRQGAIAGGSICAEGGIIATCLGNPAGLQTCVKLGGLERIRQKENKLNDSINGVNQELYALRNAHREFQRKYAPEIRNTMDIYLKIESAIYTKEKQMESLLKDKDSLEEELRKSGNATALVKGQLYEGVTVEIDGVRWQAKNVKGITLKKVDNKIAVFSNYQV